MGDQHWLMYVVSGIIVFAVLKDNIKASYQKRGAKGPVIGISLIILGFLSAATAFQWGGFMLFLALGILSSVWWLPGFLDKLFPDDVEREKRLRAENPDWDR
ncbi:hypothetical protein LWH94_17535 [Marinobacter sp. G11]|uniref:hypothetical protein n=1 Tax=Marinobacter sp. G11 TaxID=2903522 RepID=UPI001E5EADC4|nr:hypothetical protein [Marinobacter sp. G11]MCE0760985.1 hypothetical protein [Marinobacter sp. G11]